jgi:hypothetical protein
MADWEDVPSAGGGWEDLPAQRPSWSQAPGNILSDVSKTVDEIKALPGAALRAGQAIVEHPVDTAIAGGKAVVGGLVNQGRQIAGALTGGAVGMSPEEYNATVVQPSRKQAIERPLSTVANIALQGSPAGELTAGRLALKGATATTREAANIPTWMLAGVARKSSNEALRAISAGGPEAAAFRAQMSGGEALPVAQKALNAADQIAADKNAAHLAGIQKWNIPGGVAPISDVDQALANAHAANRVPSTNAVRNTQAQAALDKITQVVDQHTTIPAQGGFGPTKLAGLPVADMDALKQAIGEVMYDKNMAPAGSAARVHAGKIYDAAKDAVTSISPEYAAEMERSQARIRNLNDLRQELSLKPNASKGTILRKLQSGMREDVNSGFKARGQMLDQLAKKDPTLPAALAGQDFSSPYPRGLSKLSSISEGMLAGTIGITHGIGALLHAAPVLIPLALASSPRIQGEARSALGLLTRGARAVGATQKNIGRAGEAARVAGLLADPDRKPKGLLNP